MPYMRDSRGERLDAFDPRRDVGGLIAWYDASDLTAGNGTSMAKWADKSGMGKDIIGRGTSLPVVKANGLNGKRTVDLGAAGYFSTPNASSFGGGGLLQPSNWAQPLTFVALAKAASSGGVSNQRVVVGGRSTAHVDLRLAATTGSLYLEAGSAGAGGDRSLSDDQWHVLVGCFDTGSGATFIDGYLAGASASQSHGANLLGQLNIGTSGEAANMVWKGELAEILVIAGRLTFGEIKNATKYLSDKWGLGLTLPTQGDTSFLDTTDSTGQNVRYWLPAEADGTTPTPAVFWAHQAGGNEQITPAFSHYPLVHALVNAGYVVAASRMHGDNWGSANAITDLTNLYTLMNGIQPISKLVVVGASMGGVSAALSLPLGAFPAGKLKGLAGVDAVFSLSALYANASYTAGIDTAYGITRGTLSAGVSASATSVSSSVSIPNGTTIRLGNGTANVEDVTVNGAPSGTGPYTLPITPAAKTHASGDQISDYPAKTSGRDPLVRPVTDFNGVPWHFVAGTSDAVVNKAANTDAFRTLLGSAPPSEYALSTHGGGHLSTSGCQPSDLAAFVARCLA